MNTELRLRRETFEEPLIERLGVGGGMIPFAIDEHGTIRVLLGRERFVAGWKGSCRWSGFEGSRKVAETLNETSAREFDEESMGVVMGPKAARRIIDDKLYALRIVLKILSERKTPRYHTNHAVQIPYDATIPKRFLATRIEVEAVERLVQEWRYVRPESFPAKDVGAVAASADGSEAVEVCALAEDVADAPVTTIRDARECKQALRWATLRAEVDAAVRCAAHPALCVRRRQGWLCDTTLNADYMEKDLLKWWDLDELQHVISNRGRAGHDRFRPYFLPVLQTLIEEFLALPPSPNAAVSPDVLADPEAPRACEDDANGRPGHSDRPHATRNRRDHPDSEDDVSEQTEEVCPGCPPI
ncbi:MAG: hypothetical protein CMM02_08065 [Rhodopirellula sp.]|nr:hypothetical protein [Rhodopirellula sp.]MAT10949.1 hypothetical protein [Rhodopirellula sp.]